MVLYSPHLSEVALSRNRRSRAAWAHTAVASIPRPGGCRDYMVCLSALARFAFALACQLPTWRLARIEFDIQ